jgi:hypothetical protein
MDVSLMLTAKIVAARVRKRIAAKLSIFLFRTQLTAVKRSGAITFWNSFLMQSLNILFSNTTYF